jgi:hypothetical protein
MPAYQLYPLQHGERLEPRQMLFYDDRAALRRAIGPQFQEGCEVWQGGRFVGRVHGPVGPPVLGLEPHD